MKLKWMIILRSSFLLLTLLISCNENKKRESINNDLNIIFTDTLTKTKLYNFDFGVFYDNEELPLDFILNRKSSLIKNKDSCIVINNIKNKKDNLYGYFSKKGYRIKKFLLDKRSNYQNVMIVPESTTISIKALDKKVANDIDSINVFFKIKKNDELTEEYFRFNKKDLSPNLEYFNKSIDLGQSMDVEIKVYKNKEVYKIRKHIDYQSLVDLSITLI